jgi:hypothetical protein
MKKKESNYPMPIREWSKDDRPREKLLKYGEHILNPSMLSAMLALWHFRLPVEAPSARPGARSHKKLSWFVKIMLPIVLMNFGTLLILLNNSKPQGNERTRGEGRVTLLEQVGPEARGLRRKATKSNRATHA